MAKMRDIFVSGEVDDRVFVDHVKAPEGEAGTESAGDVDDEEQPKSS